MESLIRQFHSFETTDEGGRHIQSYFVEIIFCFAALIRNSAINSDRAVRSRSAGSLLESSILQSG